MRMPWSFPPAVSDAAKLGLTGQPVPATGETLYELLLQSVASHAFTSDGDFGPFTEVDNGSNVAVAGGVCTVKGSAAWNVNGIYLTTRIVTTTIPGKFRLKYTPKGATSQIMIGGIVIANNLYIAEQCPALVYFGGGGIGLYGAAQGYQAQASPSLNTQYELELKWLPVNNTIEIWVRPVGGNWARLGLWRYITMPSPLGLQVNAQTAFTTPWEIDDYERFSGYATDGPYLSLLADAGKLFAVSAAGTLAAGDLEDPEASVTGAVTFTGGATGRIRSYNATTGKANIHTISGTPQAGTVTCDVSGHTFTISDTGVQCLFRRFDLTRFKAVGSWATTNAKFRYAVDGGAASAWKTLAELNAVGNLGNPQRVVLDVQANSDGATQQYIGEVNAHDCTEGIGDFPEGSNVVAPDTVQGVAGTAVAGGGAPVVGSPIVKGIAV